MTDRANSRARSRIWRVSSGSSNIGLPVSGDDVVACPGTSTCRLGITSSKTIGAKLCGQAADLRIRASGCHNGCAQPETADIGIYGEGKRRHGRLIPHYQLYIGGDGRARGGLAIKGPSVPAARVEAAIERLQRSYRDERVDGETFFAWSHRQDKGRFNELLADLADIAPEDVASVLHDHGDEAAFKVEQFGGGECAGAAQETVAANFAEAANERNYRNAFLLQRKVDESLECAREVLRLVGESLLFIVGEAPAVDLTAMADTLAERLDQGDDLGRRCADLVGELDALAEAFDESRYQALNAALDAWTAEAAAVCQSIDRQLDLSASLPKVTMAEKKSA